MGTTQGTGNKRCPPGCQCGRHKSNAGSFDKNRANLDAGSKTRYVRKHPLPSIGDRFGELTVVGFSREKRGACVYDMVRVKCSCGAEPHLVYSYNLREGKSTRCNACAKKAAGYWRKNYVGYAAVCADDELRRRLLNRISAAIGRCHTKTDKQWHAYGGRGIQVFESWRKNRGEFLAYLLTLENHDRSEFDLDRIDVDEGYAPGNLRFIPAGENRGGNKRTVRELQTRIDDLERENADLRHRLQRAEELLHGAVGQRPAPST